MSGLVLWFAELGTSTLIEEFDDWYESEHVPRHMTLPTLIRCSRWSAADGRQPTIVSLYDITSPKAVEDPELLSLIERGSEREKTILGNLALMDLRVYEVRQPIPAPRAGNAYDHTKPGPYASIVTAEVPEEMEDEYNRWYEEEHIPMLRKVPQWVRSRRFVFSSATVIGEDAKLKEEARKGRLAKHMAIHEYTGLDAYESEEFKTAGSTPWMKEVMAKVSGFNRRIIKFEKSWVRE